MSDCRCSGTSGQNDTWDHHSEYCPVFMQGFIIALQTQIAKLEAEKEALREAAQDVVTKQQHSLQKITPVAFAIATLAVVLVQGKALEKK